MSGEKWVTVCCNAKYKPSKKKHKNEFSFWHYIECTKCGKITNIHISHATASKLHVYPYGDVKIK